jgi:hypothetical protein
VIKNLKRKEGRKEEGGKRDQAERETTVIDKDSTNKLS